MTTLLWGQLAAGVPRDIETVTRNSPPVNDEAEPKELNHAPDFNEVNSDPDPELGLTGRQLGSDWHAPQKYSPAHIETATAEHDDIINRRWASSGSAAEREAAGEYGHGTISYAVGIEPTIRDGAEFGTDYFAAHRHDVNGVSNMGTGVQPNIQGDNADNATAAAMGKVQSRNAYQSTVTDSLYRAYLAGG